MALKIDFNKYLHGFIFMIMTKSHQKKPINKINDSNFIINHLI